MKKWVGFFGCFFFPFFCWMSKKFSIYHRNKQQQQSNHPNTKSINVILLCFHLVSPKWVSLNDRSIFSMAVSQSTLKAINCDRCYTPIHRTPHSGNKFNTNRLRSFTSSIISTLYLSLSLALLLWSSLFRLTNVFFFIHLLDFIQLTIIVLLLWFLYSNPLYGDRGKHEVATIAAN